jgi:hypothetical protein
MWLWVAVGGVAVVIVIALVTALAAISLVGHGAAHNGKYQVIDNLCALPEVDALGPAEGVPLPEKTIVANDPYASCTLSVRLSGKYQSAMVNFSADIADSAADAKSTYQSWLSTYAKDTTTAVPGLGTAAVWYKSGREIDLNSYDDNMVFRISWETESATGTPPGDLITQLANIGQATYNACLRPGAGGTPAGSVSPLPTLASPTAPKLAFHKVDNLCTVTPFDAIGPVQAGTAKPDSQDDGDMYELGCTVSLQSRTFSVSQIQVVALLDMAGRDVGAGYQATKQSAPGAKIDVPAVGTDAFFQPDYIGGPRLVTYMANLQLSVSYFATDPTTVPKDIQTRMSALATTLMSNLNK